MINKPPPIKDLSIRIPIIIPIKGRGFINQGLGLGEEGLAVLTLAVHRNGGNGSHSIPQAAPENHSSGLSGFRV